ncbi:MULTISPECIES: hypothetical protein [Rhodopseudomonas]|uniref:Uncharacterized protein n=1 Tax=Rhodopseudomonas palustris TaxID=1076 RepID=A0A0D7EBZ6_RHOPL|nr:MULTISPECIES: hypothetical protein [Rhodopseudomonas]KIZ37102.1 hypothetical protein OO17_23955 [Rhodopseudomonas palustris]MDF3810135.1 hypothetical protein [Rhodopseudomonas sp. BAL398]WOK18242.1 hypothetical protein RBJ75_01555 [Rhodopseudomonas sp. BAL398]
MIGRSMVVAVLSAGFAGGAAAQDVPGIEICTAEKTMQRRTSCLQSNVDFLQASIAKLALDHQHKLDAANRQIDALTASITALQSTVGQLQEAQKKPAPASTAKDGSKDASKDAGKSDAK